MAAFLINKNDVNMQTYRFIEILFPYKWNTISNRFNPRKIGRQIKIMAIAILGI